MPKYFEFEVSLIEVKPKIYRKFALPAASTFRDLHRAIQRACGWENDHGHIFRTELGKKGQNIAGGFPMGSMDGVKDGDAIQLNSYFSGTNPICVYEYDFGDCWTHVVKWVRVFEDDEIFQRKLLGGARAFPPEDCGGLPGYYEFCELLKSAPQSVEGESEEDEQLRDWFGDWTPEGFDFEETKKSFEAINSLAGEGCEDDDVYDEDDEEDEDLGDCGDCEHCDCGEDHLGDDDDEDNEELSERDRQFVEEVKELIAQGKKKEAVNVVQNYLHVGLKTSKAMVDELAREAE